ncbi:hypothetical protein EMCG_09518, partial [[Emmonsia] crescens]
MKQNCKEVEFASCSAVVTSNKHSKGMNILLAYNGDWQEIITLIREYSREKMTGFSVEVTTYYNLIDISTLSSNSSILQGSETLTGMPNSQLTTQALKSKRSLEAVKNEPFSSYQRPPKSPQIHDIISDEESVAAPAQSTATTQQLKEVRSRQVIEKDSMRITCDIILQWQCQKTCCHNFEQGTCWLSFDDSHIQLLSSSDIASWVDDVDR